MGNGMDQQPLLGMLKGGGDSTDRTPKGLGLMLGKISPGRLLDHGRRSSWGLMDIPAVVRTTPHGSPGVLLLQLLGAGRDHGEGPGTAVKRVLQRAALYLELEDFDAVPVVPQLLL